MSPQPERPPSPRLRRDLAEARRAEEGSASQALIVGESRSRSPKENKEEGLSQ
jgi:hypothetical protein